MRVNIPTPHIGRVLDHLEGVEQRGNGSWTAKCPSHHDENPSLAVDVGNDGRALLKCFAGCDTEKDVLPAAGLEASDLFERPLSNHNGHKKQPSATWEIKNVEGKVQAEHVRFDLPGGKKEVKWRLPDGKWGLGGKKKADLPLYRSEHFNEWSKDGIVVVCEGEKAADALATIWHMTLGTVTGASGTPGDETLAFLRDRSVILWADANDEHNQGRKHMERIAEKLQGVASEVRIYEYVESPKKGTDAADHPTIKKYLETGEIETDELSGLVDALATAPIYHPEGVPASPSLHSGVSKDTLRAVRFNEIPDPGPRRYLLDGLIPEDYPVVLHGDGGVAKSMLALSLGLAVSSGSEWLGREVGDGGPVLYLDFELDAAEQRRRVSQLARGVYLDGVPDSMLYLSALGYPIREVLRAALTECQKSGVKLMILDSLGPALQGDAEAARDVIGFYQENIEPFRAAGVTVLIIDHQSRLQSGQSYQSKSAFGSVYKTNLARSVIQVEGITYHKEQGRRIIRLRHKKHNFGPLTDPFDVELTFSEEMISIVGRDTDPADLAEEQTLNAADRVKKALETLGPAYPNEIAEFTGLALKTAKNTVGKLKKAGEVMLTGERNGQAQQVSLVSSLQRDRAAKDTSDSPDFWRTVQGENPEANADDGRGFLQEIPM